ncbi:MAG: hypothetical protein ACRD17_13270 [Terriglobales bacterium]
MSRSPVGRHPVGLLRELDALLCAMIGVLKMPGEGAPETAPVRELGAALHSVLGDRFNQPPAPGDAELFYSINVRLARAVLRVCGREASPWIC